MEPCVTRFYSQPGPHRAVTVAHGRTVDLSLYHDGVILRYWTLRGAELSAVTAVAARAFIHYRTDLPCGFYISTRRPDSGFLEAPAIPSALVGRWLSFLPRLWTTRMYQPMYDWMAEELPAPYCFWPSDPLRMFRELAPGCVFLEDK